MVKHCTRFLRFDSVDKGVRFDLAADFTQMRLGILTVFERSDQQFVYRFAVEGNGVEGVGVSAAFDRREKTFVRLGAAQGAMFPKPVTRELCVRKKRLFLGLNLKIC